MIPNGRFYYPLRTRSALVEDASACRPLVDAMREILGLLGGLGLSAVQVGVPIRLFLLRDWPDAFINPVLLHEKGSSEEIEGCLSLPGDRVYVRRASFVKLHSYTLDGRLRASKHRGTDARVVQHELDHLEGVLITDHIPKPS